jgi:YVTN family beta-propeller protein
MRVFVTNQHDNTLSVIDPESLSETHRLAIGEFPEGIIADPSGGRIYIANWFDNEMVVLDSETLEIIKQIPTGESPRAFGVFVAGGS